MLSPLTLLTRLVLPASLAISCMACAQAGPATPGVSPLPLAPEPITPPAPACSSSFVEAARRVIVQIQAIQKSQKEGTAPKNLGPATRACNKLEGAFPAYQCTLGGKLLVTESLAAPCKQIRDYATRLKIEVPTEVPAPTAEQVKDETPVATLALDGIQLRILNTTDFAKAVSDAKSIYFIKGKTYDFASSVLVNEPIRCTIDVLKTTKGTALPIAEGGIAKSKFIDELLQSEHYITSVSFEGLNWTLDCAKHVFNAKTTDYGLTFGELKEALGSNAEVLYKP